MSILAEQPHQTESRPGQRSVKGPIESRAIPDAGEYLRVRLGAEEYGINILRVQEIRSFQQPTRIAGAPEEVSGVLNLRGDIVPVVDLRVVFKVEPTVDAFTV